jgi:hydrogenase/urease accessory protein HupE
MVQAHGITNPVLDKSALDFVSIGFEHMLLGWDHMLFVVAVVLLAGRPKRASTFLALFAAGHSLTLILASLAGWRVSPGAVDAVIALSVAYVGFFGWRGPPQPWRLFGAGVFGFGLIHGLGLATRFQELGLPQEGRLPRLLAFNLGVELGQLAGIGLVVAAGLLLRPVVRRVRTYGLRPVNAALIVIGVVAGALLANDARTGEFEELAADGGCTIRKVQASAPTGDVVLEQMFFDPGETWDSTSFAQAVNHGFVVIEYRPDLPVAEWEGLREFVYSYDRVVAGARPGLPGAVEVKTRDRDMTCPRMPLQTVVSFGDLWLQRDALRRSASGG